MGGGQARHNAHRDCGQLAAASQSNTHHGGQGAGDVAQAMATAAQGGPDALLEVTDHQQQVAGLGGLQAGAWQGITSWTDRSRREGHTLHPSLPWIRSEGAEWLRSRTRIASPSSLPCLHSPPCQARHGGTASLSDGAYLDSSAELVGVDNHPGDEKLEDDLPLRLGQHPFLRASLCT